MVACVECAEMTSVDKLIKMRCLVFVDCFLFYFRKETTTGR